MARARSVRLGDFELAYVLHGQRWLLLCPNRIREVSGRGKEKGPCPGLDGNGPYQFNPGRGLSWSFSFSLSRLVCVTGDRK